MVDCLVVEEEEPYQQVVLKSLAGDRQDPWVGQVGKPAACRISAFLGSCAWHAAKPQYFVHHEAHTSLHVRACVDVGRKRSRPGWDSFSGKRGC